MTDKLILLHTYSTVTKNLIAKYKLYASQFATGHHFWCFSDLIVDQNYRI